MKRNLRHLFDLLFKDDKGEIVLAQKPNLPIIAWAVLALLSWLLRDYDIHTGITLLSRAFLFLWAYREIESGANLFRQLFGTAVMAGVVASFFAF